MTVSKMKDVSPCFSSSHSAVADLLQLRQREALDVEAVEVLEDVGEELDHQLVVLPPAHQLPQHGCSGNGTGNTTHKENAQIQSACSQSAREHDGRSGPSGAAAAAAAMGSKVIVRAWTGVAAAAAARGCYGCERRGGGGLRAPSSCFSLMRGRMRAER